MSQQANFSLKLPSNVVLDSNILPQSEGLHSTFDLSEGLKTAIKFDNLYPVYWEELSPGDHFEFRVNSVCRMLPMVAPVMDNIRLKYFAFWVPNRLIWKDFVNFMGEKVYQEDVTNFTVPQINMKSEHNKVEGLFDYLGCPPTGSKCDYSVSALPARAYVKAYNDWFRANELQAPIKEYIGSTEPEETIDKYKILKKGKPLDYFTSCLPYPQSGEQVMIPLAGNAPVLTTGKIPTKINSTYNSASEIKFGSTAYRNGSFMEFRENSTALGDQDTGLYADMSKVTGISIEALRKASAIQVLLERDARAGERYADLVKMHYGVTCPDFLLGRSQFLGSCTSSINVNPIVQNSSTDSTTPQGNLAGIGVGQESDELCEISAVEHGIVMIMACATADVTYQQGVARKFNKVTRYDYMNPAFWNLGDQAVLNKEIFLSPDKATNERVFGYQERYRELREGISKISGKMRSAESGSLDIWHLSEKFENLPTLSGEFIESNTPISRVMAVKEEPDVVMDIWFDIKATRPLPVSGNPSLLAGRI